MLSKATNILQVDFTNERNPDFQKTLWEIKMGIISQDQFHNKINNIDKKDKSKSDNIEVKGEIANETKEINEIKESKDNKDGSSVKEIEDNKNLQEKKVVKDNIQIKDLKNKKDKPVYFNQNVNKEANKKILS